MTHDNKILITRHIDGQQIIARAAYNPEVDGWNCTAYTAGALDHEKERRGPDQTGNDVWATLLDMIELQLTAKRK